MRIGTTNCPTSSANEDTECTLQPNTEHLCLVIVDEKFYKVNDKRTIVTNNCTRSAIDARPSVYKYDNAAQLEGSQSMNDGNGFLLD